MPFHIVGMEIWAKLFFGGESPSDLSDRLLSLKKEPVKI